MRAFAVRTAPRLVLLATVTLALASFSATEPAEPQQPAPPVQPLPGPAEAAEPAPSGWDPLFIPLAGFDTDQGVGYGLRAMLIWKGPVKPYRLALIGQFFQTTREVAIHRIIVDAPEVFGSKWRAGLDFSYRADRFSPYYGLGNDSVYDQELDACAARAALAEDPDTCPDNPRFRGLRYYVYDKRTLPRISLTLRRELSGPWKTFGAYRFNLTTIRTEYPQDLGQRTDSRLVEDAKAGLLTGYDGASKAPFQLRTGELTAGLIFDSRDHEPAPMSGMFNELSLRGGTPLLGSQFSYWGVNTHLRIYNRLIPGYDRLVGAARVLFDVMGGEVPFNMLASFGGVSGGEEGVGGITTVRGIFKNRYQGRQKLAFSTELRWRFAETQLFGQDLDFTTVLGVDGGHAWRELGFQGGGRPHLSGAGGLRIAWNRFMIIRFDYARALTESSQGWYIDFDHTF